MDLKMNKSLLVKLLGFPATLIHGDTLVLDRWRWLKTMLPFTNNGESLIDIGCGTGSFTTGAALRGYETLGLSWDDRNQSVATERAKICKAKKAKFEILDVRFLHTREDLVGKFDVAICCENIEHIIDDRKLLKDIFLCLKPGGRLLLTAPNLLYRAITHEDNGPFSTVEDGGHVRRGYQESMLLELCEDVNLIPNNISYCSGFLSQKITALQRLIGRIHPILGWVCILPLRILPPLFDRVVSFLLDWPYYSICIEAYKPRLEVSEQRNEK
jgi:SAM-dependent methyltransferase